MESRPETANSDRGRSRPVPQPDEAGYFTPAVAYDDTDIEGTHTTTATGTGTTSTGLTGKSMATANMMSDMVQSRTSGSSMMRPSPVTTSDDDTVHENDHTSTTTVLRHPYQADFQERLAERYGQGQGPNQSQHQHHGHHHHRPEPQPQQAEAAPNPYEYEHEDHEVQYHSHPEIDTDRDHGFLAPGRRVKRRRRHKLHAQTRTRAGAGGQPVAMTGGPVFSKSESHSLSSHHHQHHHRHPERTSRSVESRVHDHDHQHEESASGRSGRVIRRSRSRSVEYRVTFAQPPVECSRKVVCPTSNQNQTQKIIVAAEPCHSNWNQNYQPGCQLLDNYSEFSRASSGLQDTNCVVPQPNTAVYCPEVRKASETDTELFKPDDRCHPALVVDNCIEDRRIYQQREVESRIDVTVTTMDGSGSKQEPKHERRLSGGMRHNLMFGKNFDNLHASYDADDDDEDEGRHQQRFGQKADTRNAEVRERDIKYTPPEPESEEPSTSRRSQPALDRNDPYTYAKPVFSVKKPEQPRYEIRTTPKPRETVERRVEPRHNYDHEHSFPFAGVSPSGNLKIDPKSISFENPKTAVLVANPGKSNVYVKQDRAHTHENLNLAPAPPVPPFPADYTTETQSSYRAIGTDLLANSIRGSKDFMENIRQRMRNAIDPDTTIVIDGKEFPCHYLALQVYSKFFDRHHRHRDKRLEFNIPSDIISPSVFPNLMDWILIDEHEKKMVVSKDNVVGLFSAADYLGMPLLKNDCLEFIKLKVQAEDPSILRMYEEARDNPHCAELLAMISTKLSALFPKLYKSRQFLQMNVRELCLLLQSDSLNIKTELEVYDAAARWLLYDWSARRRYTVEVMSTVRFGLLSPVELSQIQYNMKRDTMPDYGQIFANEEVKVMVEDGLKYALWREQYRTKPSELQKWLAASGIAQPKPRFNLDNALGDPRRASTSFLQNQEQEYMRDKANKAVADSMTAFGNKRLSGNKDVSVDLKYESNWGNRKQ